MPQYTTHRVLSNIEDHDKRFIVRNAVEQTYRCYSSSEAAIYELTSEMEMNKTSLHEIITNENKQRMRVDYDVENKSTNNYMLALNKANEIVQMLKSTIKKMFANCIWVYEIDDMDFMIAINSDDTKISFHIVLKNYCFTREDIVSIFKIGLINIPGIDSSVYKKNQSFRLCLSYKYVEKSSAYVRKKVPVEYNSETFDLRDWVVNAMSNDIYINRHFTESEVLSNRRPDVIEARKQDDIQLELLMSYIKPDVKNYITSNFTIVKYNESYMLRRNKPAVCTICKREHSSSGGVLNCSNGNIFLKCFRNNSAYKIIGNYPYNDLEQHVDYEKTKLGDITIREEYNEKRMRPFDNFAVLNFIIGPMGSGKTHQLNTYLLNHIDEKPDMSIRVISFRRSFGADFHKKFITKDNNLLFDYYQNIKSDGNRIYGTLHKRLIVQYESLCNITEDFESIDLLILDESESIFGQVSSKLGNHPALSFDKFCQYLKTAKQIISMDANMSDRTFNIINHFRPKTPAKIIVNKYSAYTNKVYNITSSDDELMYKMHEEITIGKKVVLVSNSINFMNATKEYLEQIFPYIRILAYSSETIESIKNEHFKNVNFYWKECDVLMFTPTCSAGVSFDVKHFDSIYGHFTDDSCDVETCRQMLGRVRDVDNFYISIKTIPKSFLYKEEDIQNALDSRRLELINGDTPISLEPDYYRIWMENIKFNNFDKVYFRKKFVSQLKACGATVKKLVLKNIINVEIDNPTKIMSTKDMMQAYENRRAQRVTNSEDINKNEYIDLQIKKSNGDDIEFEEILSIDKYIFVTYYGLTSILDYGVYIKYKDKRIKDIYRNLKIVNKFANVEYSIYTHYLEEISMLNIQKKIYDYTERLLNRDMVSLRLWAAHGILKCLGYRDIKDGADLICSCVEENVVNNLDKLQQLESQYYLYTKSIRKPLTRDNWHVKVNNILKETFGANIKMREICTYVIEYNDASLFYHNEPKIPKVVYVPFDPNIKNLIPLLNHCPIIEYGIIYQQHMSQLVSQVDPPANVSEDPPIG
jgi:hypothetical protein